MDRSDRLEGKWLPNWVAAAAARYHWPGNVRELRNAARHLAIDWADRGEILRGPDVERLFGKRLASPEPSSAPAAARAEPDRRPRRLEDIGDDEVLLSLRSHGWQPARAAEALGISRTSLYALMRKHPDIRKAGELTAEEIRLVLTRHSGDTALAAAELCVSELGLKRQMNDLGIR